jgi:peptidoglycan/xylan/chitin deacetylase (PgdA/CDA1 family)
VTLEEPIPVFLSHDVDWGKAGAPRQHVIARRSRFNEAIMDKLDEKNPYQNIREIMEIEEKHGLRSTFFFRTRMDTQHPPPSYDLQEYRAEIRSMVSGGWEVGLHSDHLSIQQSQSLTDEKNLLEDISGTTILGNRTHYTVGVERHDSLFSNLRRAGIKYDSSIKYCRDQVTERDCMSFEMDGLRVFPISVMDALIFTDLVDEVDVLRRLQQVVDLCKGLPRGRVLTILWHNCSLKMRFGRKYPKVVEYLASTDDVTVKTGKGLLGIFNGNQV